MLNSVDPGRFRLLGRTIPCRKYVMSALLLLFFVAGTNLLHAAPPGVPDMSHPNTVITVTQDFARANNIDKNVVVARVVDSDGNPVDGVTVYFTAGNVTIAVTTGGGFGSGSAQLELASGVVGTVGVSGTVNGAPFHNNVSVNFVAYIPDEQESELEVVTNGAIANNTATNSVRAIVRDANGNPVPNQTVTFQIQSGTASFVGSAVVVTDANGVAVVSLISNTAGTVVIGAVANGTPNVVINDTEAVEFVLNEPDVTVPTTRIEVVDDGALADGVAQNTVKAVITDAGGNPVANRTVTFTLQNNGIGATAVGPISGTTDANGEFIIQLVSSNPGTVELIAEVEGEVITHGSPAQVNFVADPPDVTNDDTRLMIDVNGSLADGTAANQVHVHVVDADGNPVVGQTVTFVINSGTATTSPLTVFTDAQGNAVLTLTSTVVGAVEIGATVNGVPLTGVNNSPVTVNFVADEPSVQVPTTRLEVIKNNAVADDVDINTVKAVITDANGNPVAGQTVEFTIVDGTAVFVGSTILPTDVNGEAIINFQSTVAGVVHVTATVNGTPIVNGSPAEIIFIAGAPDLNHTETRIIIDSNNADADGVAQNVVRVHVVDAYGNPVPNQAVTFSYTGVATPGGPLSVITDENGDAVLSLTSTTIGSVEVTATLNGTPVPNGSPATVFFTSFPNVNDPQTELIVVTTNAIANNTDVNVVRARVIDNTGNPMAGAEVTFTIASGDATIITPQPVVTDSNGEAVIQLTSAKPGHVEITAVADGRGIRNGSPARVRFTEDNVWIPKVFTPNGDGVNDEVRPVINGGFQLQYFNIYNRWGNLLFTSRNPNVGWDGRYKGVMQPNETYLWIIVGTDANNVKVQKRGMLTLVR